MSICIAPFQSSSITLTRWQLDTALYKKGGKKGAKGKGRGQKKEALPQYEQMMTPRNEHDMEKVEEEELGQDEMPLEEQ